MPHHTGTYLLADMAPGVSPACLPPRVLKLQVPCFAFFYTMHCLYFAPATVHQQYFSTVFSSPVTCMVLYLWDTLRSGFSAACVLLPLVRCVRAPCAACRTVPAYLCTSQPLLPAFLPPLLHACHSTTAGPAAKFRTHGSAFCFCTHTCLGYLLFAYRLVAVLHLLDVLRHLHTARTWDVLNYGFLSAVHADVLLPGKFHYPAPDRSGPHITHTVPPACLAVCHSAVLRFDGSFSTTHTCFYTHTLFNHRRFSARHCHITCTVPAPASTCCTFLLRLFLFIRF